VIKNDEEEYAYNIFETYNFFQGSPQNPIATGYCSVKDDMRAEVLRRF